MDYLTVDEVAARLSVTSLTVRRWLLAGSLGGIAVHDRVACRVAVKDLEAFIDARRRGGVQERPKRQPLASWADAESSGNLAARRDSDTTGNATG